MTGSLQSLQPSYIDLTNLAAGDIVISTASVPGVVNNILFLDKGNNVKNELRIIAVITLTANGSLMLLDEIDRDG